MTSILKPKPLRTWPLASLPPYGEPSTGLCTALTPVDVIGPVACSLANSNPTKATGEVD